jgi:hypothetical protein
MRVEQRIGRVDRIGQPFVVRAINFVLEDTVEYRVREVLEKKLAVIAEEFGVDKAADVMDSVEAEPLFDELFVNGLQNPDAIEADCETVVSQLRTAIAEHSQSSQLLSDGHELDATDARKWRDHPAQFWLERAITSGLPSRGGQAVREGDVWRVRWSGNGETSAVCFDARTAEGRPDLEWLTLEHPRARALIADLPRCVAGQNLPCVRISGLPETIKGVWSLWEITLSADDFSRRRFLPVFISDEGRAFQPTAKRVWDMLLTEHIETVGSTKASVGAELYGKSKDAAVAQGERIFADLVDEHMTRLREERDRATYAYEARHQAIGRVGLATVRDYRRKRLQLDHDAKLARLDAAEAFVPDLHAVLMLRVGQQVDVGS